MCGGVGTIMYRTHKVICLLFQNVTCGNSLVYLGTSNTHIRESCTQQAKCIIPMLLLRGFGDTWRHAYLLFQ